MLVKRRPDLTTTPLDRERSRNEVVRTNDLVNVAVRRAKMLPRTTADPLRRGVNELDSRCDESSVRGCKGCDVEADNGPAAEEVVVEVITGVDVRLSPVVKAKSAARAVMLDRRQTEYVSKKGRHRGVAVGPYPKPTD